MKKSKYIPIMEGVSRSFYHGLQQAGSSGEVRIKKVIARKAAADVLANDWVNVGYDMRRACVTVMESHGKPGQFRRVKMRSPKTGEVRTYLVDTVGRKIGLVSASPKTNDVVNRKVRPIVKVG